MVVGISAASGAVYGVRLLEVLRGLGTCETHLVLSRGAAETVRYELGCSVEEVERLADAVHAEADLAAPLSSGTYLTHAMVVAPCSVRTLSAVANSANDNLLVRAADVHLKERRRLVLVVRETPLHLGHLKLMSDVTAAGAVVLPPVPGFYVRPATIDDLVDHTVMKILDVIGIEHQISARWTGLEPPPR